MGCCRRRPSSARASRSTRSRSSLEPIPTALEPRLLDLSRKEFLVFEADTRSPERGQYAFVQSIIREVAYGMLSKADRRSRHLAAAHHFEASGDDELAGVVAAHYVEALHATPERSRRRCAGRAGARLARSGGRSGPPRSARRTRPSSSPSRPSQITPPGRRTCRAAAFGRDVPRVTPCDATSRSRTSVRRSRSCTRSGRSGCRGGCDRRPRPGARRPGPGRGDP